MIDFWSYFGEVAVLVGVIATLLGILASWRMVVLGRRAEVDLLNELTQEEVNRLDAANLDAAGGVEPYQELCGDVMTSCLKSILSSVV
jgi:hypothetical protein